MEAIRKIVVFGATSAIAQECLNLWAAQKAELILVGRSTEKLKTVGDHLKVLGATRADSFVTDFSDPHEIASTIKAIQQTLGRIDYALVAHGSLPDQEATLFEAEGIVQTYRINFISPALIVLLLAQIFEKQGSGVLGAITSVAGDRGRQSTFLYGAAKGGLSVLLQGLENRLYPKGVRVLAIKPGLIATPMTAHLKQGLLFSKPEKIAPRILRAFRSRSGTVYVPAYWRWVMFVICLIPTPIFRRLRL